MPLEERIVAWSKERPEWQSDVMRRTAIGHVLSDEDYDRLVDDILNPDADSKIALSLEHFPKRSAHAPSVRLLSITRAEHVNALASDKQLTFNPDGLTVVYGDNGSGKSGYARLLKRITGARHQEPVLSDVFQDTARDKPTAALKMRIGEQVADLEWPEPTRQEPQRMHFYDEQCKEAYVADESDFPYRPSPLTVMDGLIKACTAVRDRIDARLKKNAQPEVSLPVVGNEVKNTDAGRYLDRLSSDSSITFLDKVDSRRDEVLEAIRKLKLQEASLRNSDISKEQQRQLRQATKLDDLHKHIERIDSLLGVDSVASCQAIHDQLEGLRRKADRLARSFDKDPLSGVGSTSWKALWESARRYSECEAFPGQVFPVVGNESQCVLCQQTLDAAARDRLARFEKFVRDDIQKRLDEKSGSLDSRLEKVNNLKIAPIVVGGFERDLEPDHPDLIKDFRALLCTYEKTREKTLAILGGAKRCKPERIDPAPVLDRLKEAVTSTQDLARSLGDPGIVQQRLAVITTERKEMELLLQISKSRKAILNEIARLKERDMLEAAKSAAATGPITKKVMEFSEESITDVVRDRFTRETQQMYLERVTITRTRAEKGKVLHQPKLVAPRQTVKLRRVFSEGERSALGLAAFFTEACLDASQSALILDDPVTSLDHVRRASVAARLAQLATNRQVVIFTHDVAFVSDLKREARGQEVLVTERTVSRSRTDEGKAGVCSNKHPWKARDVNARLHDLEQTLAKIKKERSVGDQETYDNAVALWAGHLSETWERIFSQEIVGRILEEGGLEVRPQMVKVIAEFSKQDYREFEASYRRVSTWAPRHDNSPKTNYVAPSVDELEEELGLVKTWYQRVKKYKN